MNSEFNIIGPRLAAARKKCGMEPHEFLQACSDAKIHLTLEDLHRIENQTKDVTDIEMFAFAEVLNISAKLLLFGEDKLPDNNPKESS
jgi:hypothetical protein